MSVLQRLAALVLLFVLVAPARAQDTDAASPPTDPDDVASVDAIIDALYAVISGPAGEQRDWDRFRSLMLPEARLIPLFKN